MRMTYRGIFVGWKELVSCCLHETTCTHSRLLTLCSPPPARIKSHPHPNSIPSLPPSSLLRNTSRTQTNPPSTTYIYTNPATPFRTKPTLSSARKIEKIQNFQISSSRPNSRRLTRYSSKPLANSVMRSLDMYECGDIVAGRRRCVADQIRRNLCWVGGVGKLLFIRD